MTLVRFATQEKENKTILAIDYTGQVPACGKAFEPVGWARLDMGPPTTPSSAQDLSSSSSSSSAL